MFARYARGRVVVVVDDTVTFAFDDGGGEGNVYDEAATVTVAVAVFVVFWTAEDDVWASTSLFSVSTTTATTTATATAATADVFEGCFWWEIWWWWWWWWWCR